MSVRQIYLAFFSVCTFLGFTTFSLAQTTSQIYGDTITKQTQTFFIASTAEWTTYNSQAAASNTTGASSSLTVGGFAGENRSLGVFLCSTNQNLDFDLNQSRVQNNWYDLRLQTRLGYFFPSVGVSLSETKIQAEDARTIMDAHGRGVNAGLAFKIPVGDNVLLNAEALAVKSANAYDKDGKVVGFGLRQEANVHASVDLSKNMLDLLIGYKARKYTLAIEDESFVEVQSAPFAGLRLGTYF